MKHLFILNPIAGGGRRIPEVRAEIVRVMAAQGEPWELHETTGIGDATGKVKAAAASGEPLRVYACGGDGTLNECVNGAVGASHVAVTHFPAGTGNDFIKSFPANKEDFFNLERLLDAEELLVDVIDVGGRYGINICSVGFDARVGGDVHKYSKLPLIGGKLGYVASVFANLAKGIAQRFELEIGGERIERDFTMICACNGKSYGGVFTPVPEAEPDDGRMDILVVKKTSRIGVLGVINKYKAGQYRDIPNLITYFQENCMTARADKEFVINVDGEILRRREVTFRLLPRAVKFFRPRKVCVG